MKYLVIIDGDDFEEFDGFDEANRIMKCYVPRKVSSDPIDQLSDFARNYLLGNGRMDGFFLKPVERPIFISTNGESIYLTQGHVDAMIEYDKKQAEKEIVDSIIKNMSDKRSLKGVQS